MIYVFLFLVLISSETAIAQGITNPLGGGAIPVFFHLWLGIIPLLYLFIRLTFGSRNSSLRLSWKSAIVVGLIVIYLAIGIAYVDFVDQSRTMRNLLYLCIEMFLISIGLIFLLIRKNTFRAVAFAVLVGSIVLLNYYRPRLIDFHNRIYVDNSGEYTMLDVTYPGHWRLMHLQDGRILLNINPYRQYAGSMQSRALKNTIRSPISLDEKPASENQKIFSIYKLRITEGPWGWTRRPRAFFNIPLLGDVTIYKFEKVEIGKGLLLDQNQRVDCHYLYQARESSSTMPVPQGYVSWSIEAKVSDGSVVACTPYR